MAEKCANLEKCGFFNNYRANTEVTKNGWIRMYCESKVRSDTCERKKIKGKNGQPAA